MKIVLIDHQDSFTFNLVHELGRRVGRRPMVVPAGRAASVRVEQHDLVVLGPGPGHPQVPADQAQTPRALQRCLDHQIPVFGVCLGLQLIVTHFGGKVIEAPQIAHGLQLPVSHRGDGLFRGLQQPTVMMRYHSLVADSQQLPACLQMTAWTESGELMALKHRQLPVTAVQFHPESVGSPEGGKLLQNLLEKTLGGRSRERKRS